MPRFTLQADNTRLEAADAKIAARAAVLEH